MINFSDKLGRTSEGSLMTMGLGAVALLVGITAFSTIEPSAADESGATTVLATELVHGGSMSDEDVAPAIRSLIAAKSGGGVHAAGHVDPLSPWTSNRNHARMLFYNHAEFGDFERSEITGSAGFVTLHPTAMFKIDTAAHVMNFERSFQTVNWRVRAPQLAKSLRPGSADGRTHTAD